MKIDMTLVSQKYDFYKNFEETGSRTQDLLIHEILWPLSDVWELFFFYFHINKASNYLPVDFLSKRICTDSPRHLDVVIFSENSRIGLFGCVGVVGELDFQRTVPASNRIQFTCNCLSSLNRNIVRSGALGGQEFAANLILGLIKIKSSLY